MKRLILLRHPRALAASTFQEDFDRPLTPTGRMDACRIARYVADKDLIPDIILSSTALRARQAFNILKSFLPNTVRVIFDERLYQASRATLWNHLLDLPDWAETALVLGHNPGIEELAYWLAQEEGVTTLNQRFKLHYPTSGLSLFRLHVPRWAELEMTHAHLEAFYTTETTESEVG